MAIQRVTQLPRLPDRAEDAHKGTFGSVLIVAGSRGMSGAACLAGLGALRGGAGLVFVAVPEEIVPIVASVEPSYLTIPLPQDAAGRIRSEAAANLATAVGSSSVVAFGPGCGTSEGVIETARWLLSTATQPVVLDADGINAIVQRPGHPEHPGRLLQDSPGPRVLTPHPGEFARLMGIDTGSVQQQREELAEQFARENNLVLVLKGRQTVITDGGRLAVNQTGNSGMATGGSGDVLTGLLAALLAAGMTAFDAAQVAVHLHGLAGDLAAQELTRPALIASDLPRYLPRAWKSFLEGQAEQ